MKQTTKEKILNAGVKLWPKITVEAIANEIGLTHPAILYHFPNGTLKDAVAEHAVKIGESRVIVQLTAQNHKAVKKLSRAELTRHFKAI